MWLNRMKLTFYCVLFLLFSMIVAFGAWEVHYLMSHGVPSDRDDLKGLIALSFIFFLMPLLAMWQMIYDYRYQRLSWQREAKLESIKVQ